MHYLIGVVLVLMLFFFYGCARTRAGGGSGDGPGITAPADPSQRGQLAERLRELARTDPELTADMGAMCYAIAAPVFQAEYVCPTCGEKTLHEDDAAEVVERTLPSARRELTAVQGLDVELDESEFCAKCTPGDEAPSLSLLIRFPDEDEPVRVAGVTPTDIELLAEFMAGEETHEVAGGETEALKDYIDRLAGILDVSLSPSTSEVTREEMRERLVALGQSEPITELAVGAECYEMAVSPARADYTCPECGQRTYYADQLAEVVERELRSLRQTAQEITAAGLEAAVDESQFCATCPPQVDDPEPGLVIRFKGEDRTHVTYGVTAEQASMLAEFVAGEDRHADEFGVETPMNDHLPTLEQLLGIHIDE